MKKIILCLLSISLLISCSSLNSEDFIKLVEAGNTEEVMRSISKLDKEKSVETLGQALYIATKNGSVDLAEALLDKGATPLWKTFESKTALMVSSQKGYTSLVKKILDKDDEATEIVDETGSSVLQISIANNHPDIALLLLNGASVPINAKSLAFECPLYLAAKAGQLDVVKRLIEKHADVNYRSDGEMTPIFAALQGGNKEIIQLLLDNGADTSLKGVYGGDVYDIESWCNSSMIGVSSEARDLVIKQPEN